MDKNLTNKKKVAIENNKYVLLSRDKLIEIAKKAASIKKEIEGALSLNSQ